MYGYDNGDSNGRSMQNSKENAINIYVVKMEKLSLALCWGTAFAHYAMNKPSTWQDGNETWGMRDGWRAAGCTGASPPPGEEPVIGCVSQWYTNFTFIPGNATVPDCSELITFQKLCRSRDPLERAACASMRRNPWRAPGSASVASPCGIDGGNPDGCPAGNPGDSGCGAGGHGHGKDGRHLLGNSAPPLWKAGSVVEVAFGVTRNHGGGYQYRLCRYNGGAPGMTEECFQQTPLAFSGDVQWLQFDDNSSSRTAITAVRTSNGTHPPHSTWTRNPIPACGSIDGGAVTENARPAGHCDGGAQFPPPAPGVFGFYAATPYEQRAEPWGRRAITHYSIVDTVKIPDGLGDGCPSWGCDYILSFRMDSEQTPEVWTNCADVKIN